MITRTLTISGMTCSHCTTAVTSELMEIPGVEQVRIDLVAGGTSPVEIDSSHPVDEADILAAVGEAGEYVVTL